MTHRLSHYALLIALTALLTLPNLGTPSLWDMDEGVNAECTREMLETGTWVVPTYNYELRTAKPVMLYWLQRFSYLAFGVNEWAARFPSVLLSLGTVLLVYELGRRMFDGKVGLLAGVVLASSIEFCKLAHAATPDATFLFFTTLTLTLFWMLKESRAWFVPTAMASALAVLTKGPAGLALPGLVIVLYLIWNRQLKQLWDRRLITAGFAFLLVAAPWYGLVAAETRGAYIKAFFGNENVNRFLQPMESHSGPPVYYLGAILVFFAPWSVVLGATLWYAIKNSRAKPPSHQESQTNDDIASDNFATSRLGARSISDHLQHRFLVCWFGVYLVFFSFAATKLPNYIAPLYPAMALLTASFLIAWARSIITPAKWVMPAATGGLVLTGTVITVALLIMGGVLTVPSKGLRILPDLAPWAVLGLIPIAGAVATSIFLRRNQRGYVVQTLAIVAVSFVALLAAFPINVVDAAKAPKSLVAESGAKQLDRDIRLASLDYTQESVTFYAQRRVERLRTAEAATEFLAMPRPGYLFVPAKVWDEQVMATVGPHRIAARRYDFYRNAEILVVTNDGVTQ
ncbi:hypothetical protein BH11PLA2_BH11PLA2_14160 [soil metagenome]